MDDKDSKTEQPTAKRLNKARDEGDVPLSMEVKSTVMLIGALIMVGLLIPGLMHDIGGFGASLIHHAHEFRPSPDGMRNFIAKIGSEIGLAMLLPASLMMFLAVMATVGQVGFIWTPKKMKPKLSTLNPLKGAKKFVSVQRYLEVLKGMLKVTVVGFALWLVIVPRLDIIPTLPLRTFADILGITQDLVLLLLTVVILVMIVVAVLDLVYQRFSHKKKLRMTKQEVKDEHKQSEGDPKVKARIRSIRLQRHRERLLAAVPRADVVITNPTHFAVALRYDMEEMPAPMCVAKGLDHLALRIRAIAEEHNVPIVENPPLARALYATVEVDQEIPPLHYRAVAEVIGYVMRLKGKLKAA